MDYEQRADQWKTKFYNHIGLHNADLVEHFYRKIMFSPDMENPTILHAGYSPLDDTPELQELRERMFLVFEDFLRDNPA